MAKDKPIMIGSILQPEDISAWYNENPVEPSVAENYFPLDQTTDDKWKTISNASTYQNEAADHIRANSSVPVSGRPGYQDVMGEMTEFGKGYEWTADEIEKYNTLLKNFQSVGNAAAAQKLIDYYGDDLGKIRTAMRVQMAYMDWTVISDACSYEFLTANSPYFQGLVAMTYPVASWQKDAVATSWENSAALILDDIQEVLDAGEDYGKNYLEIFVNKKWFRYVRQNDQIKTQTISLVASLIGAETNPTLEQINNMLEQYFQQSVKFVVIDETVTRASLDDVKTTMNPFKDGVAVFSLGGPLGRFQWNALPIIDNTRESANDFYTVGNYTKIDPSYAKFYGKGRAFPAIDSYADNFYLKINAVAWS